MVNATLDDGKSQHLGVEKDFFLQVGQPAFAGYSAAVTGGAVHNGCSENEGGGRNRPPACE
jgi:hypothetical protein